MSKRRRDPADYQDQGKALDFQAAECRRLMAENEGLRKALLDPIQCGRDWWRRNSSQYSQHWDRLPAASVTVLRRPAAVRRRS